MAEDTKKSPPNMLNIFGEIKKNFKLKPQQYVIDNWVFKCHYRWTFLLLLVATILVTSRQYIGEHIRCISDAGVPENVMNTFCFFTTTFTLIKDYDDSMVISANIPHPGVGPYGFNSTEPIQHHAYYQWVPFVLFGQAIMFHLTHILWKKLEGQRIRLLVEGIQYAAFALADHDIAVKGQTIPSKEKKQKEIEKIKRAFIDRIYINRTWSLHLIFCEFLNVFNVVLQFFITDWFLGHKFYNLGPTFLNDFDEDVTVLDEVFPKVTKCTFHKFGPSGSIQLHDAMCVMALNIINEKIYAFLWFWFIILFIISILGIIWRFLTFILHSRSKRFNQLVFSSTCPGKMNPWTVLAVTKHCNYTDWLFLKYISKNMDGLVFRELFISLAEDLEENKPPIESDEESTIIKDK